jgi:hypothetical protein
MKTIRFSKKHEGRPIRLINQKGQVLDGRIKTVHNGYAHIVDIYVKNVNTTENGRYEMTTNMGNQWFSVIEIN